MKTLTAVFFLLSSWAVNAGYVISESDTIKTEIGARIQVLASDIETDDGIETTSDSEFDIRQFRPYVRVKFAKDWDFKMAYEFGANEDSVKDLWLRYKGVDWLDIKLGNEVVPFSRERMTSSARQHSASRSIVGEREFGVPARQVGLHLETDFDVPITLFASFTEANVFGDLLTEIQFISPWRNTDISDSLQDEGDLWVARIDFNFAEGATYRQGNHNKKKGLTLSLAAYGWENKGTLVELDSIEATEIAIAYRGFGLSIDTQINKISAESPFTLDRPLFTNGAADIEQRAIEIGWLMNKEIEFYVSHSSMKADTWEDDWNMRELGVAWYLDRHEHKVTMSYQEHDNREGRMEDQSGLYLQWQYDY